MQTRVHEKETHKVANMKSANHDDGLVFLRPYQRYLSTVEPQWPEHLWDDGNLFEIWVI